MSSYRSALLCVVVGLTLSEPAIADDCETWVFRGPGPSWYRDDGDFSSCSVIESGPSGSCENGQSLCFGYGGCFLAGTLITTPQGPVSIESMNVGDLVLTLDPEGRPVARVYNIEVEGQHTFFAQGTLVHNKFGIE